MWFVKLMSSCAKQKAAALFANTTGHVALKIFYSILRLTRREPLLSNKVISIRSIHYNMKDLMSFIPIGFVLNLKLFYRPIHLKKDRYTIYVMWRLHAVF